MKVRSSIQPQAIEFTANSVLVASNINAYEEIVGDRTLSGYEYDCTEYTKDEFMALQAQTIASLSEQLQAAKILLGVD